MYGAQHGELPLSDLNAAGGFGKLFRSELLGAVHEMPGRSVEVEIEYVSHISPSGDGTKQP